MVLAGPLEIVNYAAGNSSVSLVLSKLPARIHTSIIDNFLLSQSRQSYMPLLLLKNQPSPTWSDLNKKNLKRD